MPFFDIGKLFRTPSFLPDGKKPIAPGETSGLPPVRPPVLPTASAPAPPLSPVSAEAPMLNDRRPIRPGIVDRAMSDPSNTPRYEALTRPGPQGFKGHLLEVLKNFGAGAAQAAGTGDLGAMLGGGIAGAGVGAIRPSAGRRLQFETFQQPRYDREFQRESQIQLLRDKVRRGGAEADQSGYDAERANYEAQRSQQNYGFDRNEEARKAGTYKSNMATADLVRRGHVLDNQYKEKSDPFRLTKAQAEAQDAQAQAQYRGPLMQSQIKANDASVLQRTTGADVNRARQQQISTMTPLQAENLAARTDKTNADAANPDPMDELTRIAYFDDMKKKIDAFNEEKAGRGFDDAKTEEAAAALRNSYGEDVRIERGQGGWYFAQPNIVGNSGKTKGQIRRELKSRGRTDTEIDQFFASKGIQ